MAATGVSVQQMRGRSLRLDPGDPQKLASNWDVVCVAPDLTRGSADYERFVRKHLHLYAPADDGEIEAGPSHVHPELGPFAPPLRRPLRRDQRARCSRARPTATTPATAGASVSPTAEPTSEPSSPAPATKGGLTPLTPFRAHPAPPVWLCRRDRALWYPRGV